LNLLELKSNQTLRDIPLFSELSVQQLRLVTSFSKLKKYKKGERIFNEGDLYVGFYILLKGTVKVSKISIKGKESIVHIVKSLNAFADVPMFEGGIYPVSAEAIEESLTLFIPKEKFITLLHDEPNITFKMLAGFAKRMRSLVNQIEDLSSKEVTNRLAKYILIEIKNSGTEKLPQPFVKLAIPKSAIASYLGTITETFSRTLKKLQDEGIIRVMGKKIFVNDLKRLKDLSK
jgi:CRP/FNR family transcriptional regulator